MRRQIIGYYVELRGAGLSDLALRRVTLLAASKLRQATVPP